MGEIVVYNVKGKDIPIVHRLVRKFGLGYVMLCYVTLCCLAGGESLELIV